MPKRLKLHWFSKIPRYLNTEQNRNFICKDLYMSCMSYKTNNIIIHDIPNCKRPITSHHSYHVTIQYPTVWYGCYWTVVIAKLSAVDLPGKVIDKSRWTWKASEWCAGSFRLIVCKQSKILFIINNIIAYALRIVLINYIEKDIWLRALETKQNMNNFRPMYSLSACWCPSRFNNTWIFTS